MNEVNSTSVSALMRQGEQLQSLLVHGELVAAEQVAERYLHALEEVFGSQPRGEAINVEKRQALLQFQLIHDWVGQEKQQAEAQLRQFSQAGRASGLYKLNAG
ncbi:MULTISPECIES: hypothetical protein [Aeromonas]|uniref:hypothetical protein n=1 Tax=Aeromonas TaxID=642 RepID=UPI00119E8B89|nr:hypothetical protein [Aeromonas veronii]MDX7747044.1 hypothetical protein [Aeromonas veronii]